MIVKRIDEMTDEEILAEMREKGKKSGTPEHFIYSLLSTAHPNAIEMIEKQALQMKKIGFAMGKEMNDAGDDPQKKSQILSVLEKASQGFKTPDDDDNTPSM